MDTPASPPHLTPAEARRSLGISVPTYHRWLKSGRLRGVRAGRTWRFPESAIAELLRPGRDGFGERRHAMRQGAETLRRLLLEQGRTNKEIDAMLHETTPATDGDRLARLALEHAHRGHAETLHLEPAPEGWTIRERVEGALAPAGGPLPREAALELLAALKTRAGLEPTSVTPGEGRFFGDLGGRRVEVLVSSFPTSMGESLTLRLLDPEWVVLGLDRLGFTKGLVGEVRDLLHRPSGVFIVNGPTGSGKTTTLYSLLKELRRPDLKIMTAEDPVEFNLEGVQQSPVSGPGGTGFVAALRAMMRHDLDIAMISEVRDAETMRLIFTTAAVGHLVLTALHAPDGAEAIHRLLAVGGIDRSILAGNLLGVLTQRLVRLGCPECRTPSKIRPVEAKALGISRRDASRRVVYNRGCAKCRQTGFRGRTVVGELLAVTPAVRRAIEAGATPEALRASLPGGFSSLREDLLQRVWAGEVSPREAAMVVS